jgi:hypothetical protein
MDSAACNIGGSERTRRWIAGAVGLGIAIALGIALAAFHAPWWSGVLLFGPLWMGGLGLFQAQDRVCVALAAKNVRNFGSGEQPIEDPALNRAIRQKARRIHFHAVAFAAVLTAAFLLLTR